MKKLPPSLYKYLPARRAGNFFNKPALRFTPIAELNDIFEVSPSVKEVNDIFEDKPSIDDFFEIKPSVKRLSELLEEEHESWEETSFYYEREESDADSYGNYDIFGRYDTFAKYDTFEQSKVEQEYYSYLQYLRDEYSLKWQREAVGVLSLSSICDSLLMWAHYCENHSGFLVELDTASQFFQPNRTDEIFMSLKSVTYSAERPIISTLDPERKIKPSRLWTLYYLPLYFTKSHDWSYEEEWRIITGEVDSLNAITDDKGCPIIGLVSLPLSAIKSVIIGAQAKPCLRKQARSFSEENNIQLKVAIPDRRRFALNIVEIM